MFEKLKLYTVHTKTDESGEVEDVQFIRLGFNPWAFIFGILLIWPLVHRCWRLLGACIVIWVVTELMGSTQLLSFTSIGVIQIGAFLLVGLVANDELRDVLAARGYTFSGVTAGSGKIQAQLRYFDRLGRPAYL